MKLLYKAKYFVLGMVVMVLMLSLSMQVFAAGTFGSSTITVSFPGIKLVIDGQPVIPKDVNGNVVEPFTYNDTTYLPVRAVTNALGKDVSWDEKTQTIHIGDKSAQAPAGKTISDSLAASLNTYWLTGKSKGPWAYDKTNDFLWCIDRPNTWRDYYHYANYLPFNSDKYSLSSNYTVTVKVDVGNEKTVGGFYFGWDQEGVNDSCFVAINSNYIIFDSMKHEDNFGKSISVKLTEDTEYELKVVVSGNNLDVYIDDGFVTSFTIPDTKDNDPNFGLLSFTVDDTSLPGFPDFTFTPN